MAVIQDHFGYLQDGQRVKQFTLIHASGMTARLCSLGATLTGLTLPDFGEDAPEMDVVLGFDDLEGYLSPANQYFGCTTGRVANRIQNAFFELEGKKYELLANNGLHHLHGGGAESLDKVVWQSEPIDDEDDPSVIFTYISPDGQEGYPGELTIMVRYTLTDECSLKIEYRAETNQTTPVNLTNHAYWNLAGAGSGSVLDHELTVFSEKYTPTDDQLIPTGELASVAGTPFDFRRAKSLKQDLTQVESSPAMGYDHNFVLKHETSDDPVAAGNIACLSAILRDPASGRTMEVLTSEPGLQVYTGNFLTGEPGKSGLPYSKHGAICLEAQHFPDSVNQPNFPDILLNPGQKYRQTTIHRFSKS